MLILAFPRYFRHCSVASQTSSLVNRSHCIAGIEIEVNTNSDRNEVKMLRYIYIYIHIEYARHCGSTAKLCHVCRLPATTTCSNPSIPDERKIALPLACNTPCSSTNVPQTSAETWVWPSIHTGALSHLYYCKAEWELKFLYGARWERQDGCPYRV